MWACLTGERWTVSISLFSTQSQQVFPRSTATTSDFLITLTLTLILMRSVRWSSILERYNFLQKRRVVPFRDPNWRLWLCSDALHVWTSLMGEYHYFVAWFVFGVERESFDVPEDYFSIWWPWSKLKTIFGVPSHSVHWVVMPHETVKLHQSFYTFLLRFLISQRLTSLSSPPDSSKWGLFRLKSTE